MNKIVFILQEFYGDTEKLYMSYYKLYLEC